MVGGDERTAAEADEPEVLPAPRIGLASYDLRDPAGTFQTIEPAPLPARRSPTRALLWTLRVALVWFANLGALAFAGLIATTVGGADPVAYVTWGTVFGVANVAAGRYGGPFTTVVSLVLLPLALDVALVWLMTVAVPPPHGTDPLSIVWAAGIMWLVNLPLRPLLRSRSARQPGT
jgi:hypothetical protein